MGTIEKLLSFDSTYTTLEIGTPPQKFDFFFNITHHKMFLKNIKCKNSNLFNVTKSKTFQMLGELNPYDENGKNIIVVLDTINFYDDINLSKKVEIKGFPLYYTIDVTQENQNVCGNIGLSVMQLAKNDIFPEEFEYYLKYLRTQNNYFSFFNYKGGDYIVNSIFLNNEFKDIFYDVKNISWVNPVIRDSSIHWEISMKEIYYNKIHFKKNIILELNPLFELISGTNDYKENIKKDFFNYYINKKICLINEIKDFQVFECNSNKFTNKDINKFPYLYMFNNDLNHVFEITTKELFNKLNNKYYFNIVFPIDNSETNKWIIGKIFFRKYPVIFCPKNRILGFYINPNEGVASGVQDNLEINSEKSNISKNIPLYLIIVVVSLIFTCFGIYIGRKLFFPKFRKAKELTDTEDYYEYDSQDINSNEKERNNKSKQNYTSIEMNCKLDKK